MSSKEIVGFLSVDTENGKIVKEGNLAFKSVLRRRANYFWNNNTVGSEASIYLQPFKQASILDDNDTLATHGIFEQSFGTGNYPANTSAGLSVYDYRKFRATGTVSTINSSAVPRVIGSVAAIDPNSGPASYTQWGGGDIVMSLTDVPRDYSQIGITYVHPTHSGAFTVTTSTGLSYVTYTNGNAIVDTILMEPHAFGMIRIETGSDAGFYFVHMRDPSNNRLYLRNLDGTMFSALASATVNAQACPGRRAFFNEVSVIPLSVGQVETSGRFFSRNLRESFNVRFVFEKSGSVATAGAQQGSYFVRMMPYTHGDGIIGVYGDYASGIDFGFFNSGSPTAPFGFNFFDGGVTGYAFDKTNQRIFFGYTNASGQSGIAYWKWKTCEGFKELANYLGTPYNGASITPAINLGGPSPIISTDAGSNAWAYFGINHASGANGGIAIIKPDLTTLQYNTGNGFPNSQCYGAVVDKSRTRTGTAGDASTNGSNQITSASAAFTDADIGRAIKLTGLGADSGTYKIATRVSGTAVTVQTMAGGAVTFTSQSGGTFEIGDRLYLFFNNGTTGAGKINYMEQLVPGTFLTRTVTMTNGATITTHNRVGCPQKCVVDQTTGNVYWLSTDTQHQINKYDVTANTHSFRTIADVQSPSGGTGTISNLTQFTAIFVNPMFDELWVGSDQGHIKLVLSNFTGSGNKRYFGNDQTTYANPSGFSRSDGSSVEANNTRFVQAYWGLPDGKVWTFLSSSVNADVAVYGRNEDSWFFKINWATNAGSITVPQFVDDVGRSFVVCPGAASTSRWVLGAYELDYQWDNANTRWIPKEVVLGPLPNKETSDTISPGCAAKPLHSSYDDVLYGLTVRFTPQGGATPANNEFLGRAGVTGSSRTDGATTSASATFTGSSFVSGDVGRLIRIESGADANVYKITGFTNSTTITLSNMVGSSFSASATASSLTYSIWDLGTPGSNAGPEVASVLLADGFAKDNTQDISGITYETYLFKTVLYENDEGIKFCVPSNVGPPGSLGMTTYYETFARATPQYDAAVVNHRALPGSPLTNGDHFLDNFVDKVLDGTNGRANMYSSPSNPNIWYGNLANSSVLGCSPIVDLGADADVGFVIIRGQQVSASNLGLANTATSHGLIANLFNASDAGGAPVASSSIRITGSGNFNTTANTSTVSLSSGDFLGSITTGPNSDGSITSGGNTFSAAGGTFVSGDAGKILKVTSGTDVGSYRIVSVAGGGASVTVRNLDQSTKQWTASGSSITYEVRDGAQELDMLCSPSLASPTHKLLIERLLSTTSAQVRTPPNASLSNQNYQCVRPTWTDVKRVSQSTEATAPDVKNNSTFVSIDGREQYATYDFKIFMDLTDLASSKRTGRYWKLGMTPRFASNSPHSGDFRFTGWEFYKTDGTRLGVLPYQFNDSALQNSDFLSTQVSRVDFIQSSNTAVGGSYNGVASLGGANGDTITLSGGNKFLGFQVRSKLTDGNPISGGGTFNSASGTFVVADVGRFLKIDSGANSGSIYRIASRASSTQVTLVTPTGTSVVFGSTETSIDFTIPEGIANGGSAPDFINLGSVNGTNEFTISAINDALTQITILESGQAALSGQSWEIRRRGFDTSSSTTEAGKTARITRPETVYPIQTGDICADSRGALRFYSEDIGAAATRSDGSITGGSGVFTGSLFTQDDVGRILVITTGANKGVYRISVFTSATSITVVNAYTGAAVSFTADAGPVTYKMYGERRFRLAKYVVTLRA